MMDDGVSAAAPLARHAAIARPALSLDHVMILSPDRARLAAYYADVLAMTATPLGSGVTMCEAPGRRILFGDGSAKRLGFAAFRCAGAAALASYRDALAASGVAALASPSPLAGPGDFAVVDPDGNRVVFTAATAVETLGDASLPSARLQHSVVATQAIDPLRRFYERDLGFGVSDQVLDDAGGLRAVFLRSDHEHHSIALFRAPETRLDHHCFETRGWDELRDWADRLAAGGHTLKWGPGRHGPGNNLFIMVEDPDGNWIEWSAELQTVEPDYPTGTWPHTERTLNLWGHGKLRS